MNFIFHQIMPFPFQFFNVIISSLGLGAGLLLLLDFVTILKTNPVSFG